MTAAIEQRTCSHPDCTKPPDARSLCKTHYATHRNRQVACGTWTTSYTDATETRDWINHLRGNGIGLRRLAELTDIPRVTLYHLASGNRRRVTHRIAGAVLAVRPAAGHHLAAHSALVDATGSRRRIRALSAIGYPSRQLCGLLGLSDGNLSGIFAGTRAHVFAAKARQIEDLYNGLRKTPGPSNSARRRAAAKGWLPPTAWIKNTIDTAAPPSIPAEPTYPVERTVRDVRCGDCEQSPCHCPWVDDADIPLIGHLEGGGPRPCDEYTGMAA